MVDCQDVQLACPACGSRYFLSSRSAPKIIFHVLGTVERKIFILRGSKYGDETIDREDICCGSCSWHGHIEKLQEALI